MFNFLKNLWFMRKKDHNISVMLVEIDKQLKRLRKNMTEITDFVTKTNLTLDSIEKSVDAITVKLNTPSAPPVLSAEDKLALDAVTTRVSAVSDKVSGLAA